MKRLSLLSPLLFTIILAFLTSSCSQTVSKNDVIPSWYINQKNNNAQYLYGTAQGHTLEEATKNALADAASRLMVSISSNSTSLLEENQLGINEELRQKVTQNVEKISFNNFQTSRSDKMGSSFFIEVKIKRAPFINDQKERLIFVEKKISNLEKNSIGTNAIQRRNSLIKIIDLSKEVELKSRILAGAGENINLNNKLDKISYFEDQLEKVSNNTEFYFDTKSPKELTNIIRNGLNKEQLKIALRRNSSNPNQILVKVRASSRTNEIYESFMTKVRIDFENYSAGKILASSSIEVTGSSTIGSAESKLSALTSFEERVEKDGILKIIGIINN